MDPDWKLILTHMAGFIITVSILKKFAWVPILGILDERREKIKSEFDSIEAGKADVATQKEGYEAKLRDIDALARQKLTEAVNEGQEIAAEIKAKGHSDANQIVERAKEEIERDKDKARAAMKDEMVRTTIAAAEKIISAKMDDEQNRRLISDFIDGVEKA